MNINIYGSTGEIGSKTLAIINKHFPKIKINLLLANRNYKKLLIQAKKYNPQYVCLNDKSKNKILKKELIKSNIKIISPDEINDYIYNSKSDLSILSISGYQSLNYIESIFNNTKQLGLVNKECIVAAGHLFNKLSLGKKINIYPLDSEHFSLMNFFNNNIKLYNKIYLTATGGPFLNHNLKYFNKITFKEAVIHPKWKMGYKNSIDSSTLANKCLELIEANYLFNIPYKKMDIKIHPEAFIHSIIELKNYTSIMNYFYPDMFIPLYNFLKDKSVNFFDNPEQKKFNFNNNKMTFLDVDPKKFPIFATFQQINKESPIEIIKFNCANEIAVENFKKGKLNFTEIHDFIDKSLSLDFTHKVNSINDIIVFQEYYKKKLNL